MRKRERERKRERGRERERKRLCEKEGEREEEREVIEFISLLSTMAAFLFLKGMAGALAPFSYLVFYNAHPT